jgi:hypothetical protein
VIQRFGDAPAAPSRSERSSDAATEGAFTTITQPPVNGKPVFEETFSAIDCAPGD